MLSAATSMTLQQFKDRIAGGFAQDDEEWRASVGYRKDDRDMGFSRWCEITETSREDALASIEPEVKPVQPVLIGPQLNLF